MTEPTIQVTDKDVLKVDVADAIEAYRAQRNEHADASVMWFAKFVAASRRIKELEAELAKLKPADTTLRAVE